MNIIRNVLISAIIAMVLTLSASLGCADVVIVVNKENPVKSIKKSVLARYFLRKSTRWDIGFHVMPIDLTVRDPIRKEFSQDILKKSPHEVEEYWIAESLTGGKLAPEIVVDSSLVKKRVAADEGAIGYIDRTQIDDTIKAIEIVD